jgi:hypothetical protein
MFKPGSRHPLGVAWLEKEKSYDFSHYSRHVAHVALVLHSAEIWSCVDG